MWRTPGLAHWKGELDNCFCESIRVPDFWGSCRVPIVARCCQCIIGCAACFRRWVSNNNTCPHRQSRSFKDLELKGVDDALLIEHETPGSVAAPAHNPARHGSKMMTTLILSPLGATGGHQLCIEQPRCMYTRLQSIHDKHTDKHTDNQSSMGMVTKLHVYVPCTSLLSH